MKQWIYPARRCRLLIINVSGIYLLQQCYFSSGGRASRYSEIKRGKNSPFFIDHFKEFAKKFKLLTKGKDGIYF